MGNRFQETIKEKKENTKPSETVEDAARAAIGESEVSTKRLNVRVPEPLYEAFKSQVENEGRTMTWVIKQFMRDYSNRES